MLINKWVIIDSVDELAFQDQPGGICFCLSQENNEVSKFHKLLQLQPFRGPLSILLSCDEMKHTSIPDSVVDAVISIFFQPSYYMVNYQPLIFLINKTVECLDFCERLRISSKKQGLNDILVVEAKIYEYSNVKTDEFAYRITGFNVNYDLLLKDWVTGCLDNKNPAEIHLLVSSKDTGLLNEMLEKEKKLRETRDYKIANLLYQKQQLIEEYRHELFLKTLSEQDAQHYLTIQKEERANGLKWYYYEYEILPTWYKRLGHIIKVLMGKRTFRSLFDDNVKKYKD